MQGIYLWELFSPALYCCQSENDNSSLVIILHRQLNTADNNSVYISGSPLSVFCLKPEFLLICSACWTSAILLFNLSSDHFIVYYMADWKFLLNWDLLVVWSVAICNSWPHFFVGCFCASSKAFWLVVLFNGFGIEHLIFCKPEDKSHRKRNTLNMN